MLLGSLLFLFAGSVSALRLPIERRSPSPRTTNIVLSNLANSGNTGFTDVGNGLYTATIHVQGQPVQVQIDSGSSDLWINNDGTDLQGLTDTNIYSTTFYGDGSVAEGPIVLANVSLGGFTVSGQALVTAPGSNATITGADQGLLGVGLFSYSDLPRSPMGSSILGQLNGTSSNGLPFLQNVFNTLPNDSKYMTLLLSRSAMGTNQFVQGGALTIGELVSNYSNIVESPRLPAPYNKGWFTFLDGMTVNGVFHPGNSSGLNGKTANFTIQPIVNQSFALLDSGTSLARVPRTYLDYMYKDLPGAVFTEDDDGQQYYTVPCNTKVSTLASPLGTFFSAISLSNISYPVHPLDSVIVNVNTSGEVTCRGAFGASDDPLFTLGDTFMHNVYTLYYHGNGALPSAATDESTAPYIQLLSLVDPDEAFAEYDKVNLQRIAQNEYENFAEFWNITSSTPLAAATTYTWPIVNATGASLSTTRISITTSVTTTSASVTLSTSTVSPSTASVDDVVAAAVAKPVGTSASASLAEWTELNRNVYVIIGLLSGALVLGIVCFALTVEECSGREYSRVHQEVPPFPFREPEATPLASTYRDRKR
ncbi:aspartic peptidase domain-containing protein [Rhodofomes roseus]|uniref:Aspartic peptidase domain-containing protein n=1 Tax=Rhodofomes roseus TaxID=34475 RepID=A0ABQ8KLJ8_9APHY|nr:aspartic peptidase domain-containing protein [Rhodofomes roseus]KAH9838585.1 aspartic peptidase domain-containing protein [Rhodofomes roseus]